MMVIESSDHLERLRNQPEIKVALLRLLSTPESPEVRFDRLPKNSAYWSSALALAEQIVATRDMSGVAEQIQIYGKPCWLLAVPLVAKTDSPYVVAVAAADGAPIDVLVLLLKSVCHDYWFGSTFFK